MCQLIRVKIRLFFNQVEDKKNTITIMNSALFTNIDFEDFYLHFIENDAMMSVAAIPYTL